MHDANKPAGQRRKGRPTGKLKEGRTVSCYLRDDLYDGLTKHCAQTGLSKTAVIERAVEDLLVRKGVLPDG